MLLSCVYAICRVSVLLAKYVRTESQMGGCDIRRNSLYFIMEATQQQGSLRPTPYPGQDNSQESQYVPENVVQAFELCQDLCCDNFPGKPVPNTLWVKKISLITNLNLPWSKFRPFPRALSLVTAEKRCTVATPVLPRRKL